MHNFHVHVDIRLIVISLHQKTVSVAHVPNVMVLDLQLYLLGGLWEKRYMNPQSMISVLLPSIGREQKLDNLLTIVEDALPDGGEIIAVLDYDDIVNGNKYDTLGRLIVRHLRTRFIVTRVTGCWRCKNVALEYAKHDLVLWTADDVMPQPGWLEKGMACFKQHFPDGLGLVALNDLHDKDQIAGHAITTRRFLTVMFGHPYFPVEFRHFFLDTMTRNRAVSLDRYCFCEDAVVEHMHWRMGKSERDATNVRNEGIFPDAMGDEEIKNAMDVVWFNQGGLELAMNRLKEAT